jgi:hypothetical protein
LDNLDSYGIRLNPETLEVDFSMVKNQDLKSKLQRNPLVKYALLQREDQYNFPHLKNQKIIADELRREVHRLRKQERIEKDELEKSGVQEMTSGIIDKGIGFNYEKIQAGGKDIGDLEDLNQIQELTEEELKYGSEYRLDSKNYTLESREERTARLEERWIRERMAGLSSLDKHAESDEGEVENYEKLQKLIGNVFKSKKNEHKQRKPEESS